MITAYRLRRKLFDYFTAFSSLVSFLLLIAVVVGIEIIILQIGARYLPEEMDSTAVAIVVTLLIILGYNPLRVSINRITKRIFFSGSYDFDEVISKLQEIMASELNIVLLEQKLLNVLASEMKLSSASFVLVSDFRARPLNSLDSQNATNIKFAKLESLLHRVKKTLIFEELTEAADKEIFIELGIKVILPLVVGDEDIGLLVLGPKVSKNVFTTRDIQLLETFARSAGMALKNTDSYRNIQEFNRTLEVKVLDRTHELEESQAAELRLKDEFVFIATHDLATPVTAISGFSALINNSKEPIPPQLKSYLSAITEASNRLKVLVNDLLQVARSDSGTIKVEVIDVDAKNIVEVAIREITPLANEKNVKIILNLGSDNMLKADPVKFSEICENIMSNGVKYNKNGGTLTVSSNIVDNKYALEFKDTGIGIPEDEQKKVFTKFFRSEEPEVRQRPGTGLGLFVARMLTEKMGGHISFESIEGQGTTFKLIFNR